MWILCQHSKKCSKDFWLLRLDHKFNIPIYVTLYLDTLPHPIMPCSDPVCSKDASQLQQDNRQDTIRAPLRLCDILPLTPLVLYTFWCHKDYFIPLGVCEFSKSLWNTTHLSWQHWSSSSFSAQRLNLVCGLHNLGLLRL